MSIGSFFIAITNTSSTAKLLIIKEKTKIVKRPMEVSRLGIVWSLYINPPGFMTTFLILEIVVCCYQYIIKTNLLIENIYLLKNSDSADPPLGKTSIVNTNFNI
jgi:hypothetical protein